MLRTATLVQNVQIQTQSRRHRQYSVRPFAALVNDNGKSVYGFLEVGFTHSNAMLYIRQTHKYTRAIFVQ